MLRVNGYPVYLLGHAIGALREHLLPEVPPAQIAQFLFNAQSQLATLVNDTTLTLPLSKPPAAFLLANLQELTAAERLEQGAPYITGAEVANLTAMIFHFQSVFFAELGQLDLYFVSPKSAYNMAILLSDPGRLFGDLKEEVLAIAGRDVEEAARAYAFELGTAAAFHMLRACERVMVVYCRACALDVPDDGSWSQYIGALATLPDLPPRMKQRLDRLREYDGNEIMHPARFVEPTEVDDLFDYVKSSVKDMVRDIRRRLAGLS